MPLLRSYRPEDWPQFLSLDLETALSALGDSTQAERDALVARWPQRLAEKQGLTPAGPSSGELWVLEGDDGGYLGHLWLVEKDGPIGGRRLEVATVAVTREARGKNLGRLLMRKAEEVAQERTHTVIELSVMGNNRRARELFQDLGYQVTRQTLRKRLSS